MKILFFLLFFFDFLCFIECFELSINILSIKKRNYFFNSLFSTSFSNLSSFSSFNCFLSFFGLIKIELEQEIYFLSGKGFLNITSSSNNQKKEEEREEEEVLNYDSFCEYVTVTSVEANHQQVQLLFLPYFTFLS